MLIREWRKEDVEEIAVLEKECFSDPWTKEMLISSSLLSGFCGFVPHERPIPNLGEGVCQSRRSLPYAGGVAVHRPKGNP